MHTFSSSGWVRDRRAAHPMRNIHSFRYVFSVANWLSIFRCLVRCMRQHLHVNFIQSSQRCMKILDEVVYARLVTRAHLLSCVAALSSYFSESEHIIATAMLHINTQCSLLQSIYISSSSSCPIHVDFSFRALRCCDAIVVTHSTSN